MTSVRSAFPKTKRLLRHADFQRVYDLGRRQFTGNMTVFFLRRCAGMAEDEQTLRVGLTVGRAMGGAVERNRIRRRMREAVRTAWPARAATIDVVFNPRRSVLELPFAELAQEVARGIQLAIERAREAQQGVPENQVKRK